MPELWLERVDFVSLVKTPAVPDAYFAVKKSANETGGGDREVISKHVDAPETPPETTSAMNMTEPDSDDNPAFEFSDSWVTGGEQSDEQRSIVQKIDSKSDTETMSDTFVKDAKAEVQG